MILSTDMQKAFDKVQRSFMRSTEKKKPGIAGIYAKHNKRYMVKPESTYTILGPFTLKSGMRQDYSLSLLFFSSMLSLFRNVENTKNILKNQ